MACFIVTKTTVYGCKIPKTTKNINSSELIRIPTGSVGTVLNEYVDGDGIVVCVVEFDDNVWAWVGETAYERYTQ